MMARAMNPGNLHVRLGMVQSLYEQAVYAGDLETASSMLGIIETYCSVHLTQKERAELHRMPGFSYGDQRANHEVFRDMNARLLYVLDHVKEHGVFTKPEYAIGDATSLDEEEASEVPA